jgi:hypothetical protein
MTKVLRVLMCALLLLFGSASAATATHGQPDRTVPIEAVLVGVDEEPIPGVFPGCTEVGAPLLWRFTSAGTGTVSHLGRVTYHLTHCTHVDLTITEGVLTLWAANGDELVLTYTAAVTSYEPPEGPVALWEMAWTPASGSGRFAEVAGSGGAGYGATYTPFAPPELAGTTELDLTGMVAYDASNRSMK